MLHRIMYGTFSKLCAIPIQAGRSSVRCRAHGEPHGRSQGEVSDNRVKCAGVLSPGATVKQNLPPWARDLTTKLPPRPAFETPDNETLTQCGIALGVLTALTLAQGCSQVSFSSSHLKLLWFMIHIHILTLIHFPCLAASWCR